MGRPAGCISGGVHWLLTWVSWSGILGSVTSKTGGGLIEPAGTNYLYSEMSLSLTHSSKQHELEAHEFIV